MLNISKLQVPEFTIYPRIRLPMNENINRILFVFDISDNVCLKLQLILHQSIYALFVRNDSLSYDTIRQVFQEFLQETKTM